MKNFVSFILVTFIVVCLVSGCGGSVSNKKDTSSKPNDANGIINTSDVTYKKDDESVYTIIKPEDSHMDEGVMTSLIYKQIKNIVGVNAKTKFDVFDSTDNYEILVGPTNRPESQQALDYLISKTGGRYNEFVICTIGKKIVINAFNAEALENATNYFINNFIKAEGIKGGIDYTYAVQGDFNDITINGTLIGRFRIIRPHFNFSYLPQSEAEKIVDYVYETTGFMLEIAHDEYNEIEGEYEIVIGNAQRENVPTITNYDEYTIKVSGKRVFLNGGSPHATGIAVSEFAKMIKEGNITDASSVVSGSYENAMAGYDRSNTYYPTWYDTFDGYEIDTTKWHIMNDPEFSRAGQNGKWSAMTNDPTYVFQSDGKFFIYGHETKDTYYGGTITNKNFLSFHYGYVEKSALVPDGPGFWSLLWFCGTKDGTNVLGSPEIDLNECFGEGKVTYANCHAWPTDIGKEMGYKHTSLDGDTYGNDKMVTCPDGKTFAEDFHTYGFLWNEEYQAFYLDGEEWFRYRINTTDWDTDVFVNSWMYMQLSFSVGRDNNSLLCNDLTDYEWQNTSHFAVDWIYLYQLEDGKQGLKLK